MLNFRRGYRLTLILSFLFTVCTLLYWAQGIEREYMPVVEGFHISNVSHTEQGVVISGDLNKIRDCRFLSVAAYAGNNFLAIDFLDRVTPQSPSTSRAVGYQSFGPWRLIPDSRKVRIYARHQCHPLWDTTTELTGDIEL